jgi:hypothetical protein
MAMEDKCESPDFAHEYLSFVSRANDHSALGTGLELLTDETTESSIVARVDAIKSQTTPTHHRRCIVPGAE